MSWQAIVKEKGIDASEVHSSKLFGSLRLDAECYQTKYLGIDLLLSKKITNPLVDFAKVTDGDHSKFPENQESEVRYLRSKDIKKYFLVDDDPVFVSTQYFNKQKRSHIFAENILISIMGNVGDITITPKVFDTCIANRAICILKNININPYFLFAYLISDVANLNIERLKTGGVQERINLEILQTLPIPISTDEKLNKKIEDLIVTAHNVNEKSKKSLKEAEQMLLKEINLEDYKGTEEAISVRKFSEALADDRFDAEYWQPKYDEIEKKVSKVPQEKLGDIVSVKKGVEVGSEAYTEEGKDFIRIADFSIYGIDDVEKKISSELYESLKENYKPKKGEVLFTKDGTIGISFALNEDVDVIVSSAFLRLKPKIKINNNYLALVLNSFYCKAQIERMSGGAIIAHLKPESATQVKIPMLSEQKQEELAGMVLEALRLRKEAKELLEKAKRAVEIFVEKNEEEALKYLAS